MQNRILKHRSIDSHNKRHHTVSQRDKFINKFGGLLVDYNIDRVGHTNIILMPVVTMAVYLGFVLCVTVL